MKISQLIELFNNNNPLFVEIESTKNIFEDSFIEKGMKFQIVNIQTKYNGCKIDFKTGNFKEHNRKFYVNDFYVKDGTGDCEQAGSWNEIEDIYFNSDDEVDIKIIQVNEDFEKCFNLLRICNEKGISIACVVNNAIELVKLNGINTDFNKVDDKMLAEWIEKNGV